MREYEKIDTVFNRDIKGSRKLINNDWRDQAIKMLKDINWIWTEKIDGVNIRVHWDGHKVEFGGRSDKTEIPKPLLNRLNDLFGGPVNEELFEQSFGGTDVVLFGEGYGKKIQSGDCYIPDGVDFMLFDVLVDDVYQHRDKVDSCAEMFGVKSVPIAGQGTLDEAVQYVKTNPKSLVGTCDMEGLVCRPEYELRDSAGNRIIVKIKWRDIKELI